MVKFRCASFSSCLTWEQCEAYVRPSGGLLSEMCNIAQVLQHFLKGHIGAILTSGSHHDEIATFHFFAKVVFCDTSTVILMILKIAYWSKVSSNKNWDWNMHFFPSQSISFKRAPNPSGSWKDVSTTGGEGREGLKHPPLVPLCIKKH